MHSQYSALFKAIDDYVRVEHRCFVSECFLNPSHTGWMICVRPTNENARTLDRYACKYLRLTLQEAEEVCTSNTLSSMLRLRVDSDLQLITDRQA
jgi:hypothetical protein